MQMADISFVSAPSVTCSGSNVGTGEYVTAFNHAQVFIRLFEVKITETTQQFQ